MFINMAMDDADQKEYRWETGYEKTWEAIREDDEGLIASSVEDILQRSRRRRLLEKKENVRLGMMRHLYLVIDLSDAMKDQDLKPTRQKCCLKMLEGFINEYFDHNPISQLGIIITRNKRAEKLTELSGNAKKHIGELKKAVELACGGEPSLQNSLELAAQTLRHLPSHVSREVLIIFGSLTTCDPGNVISTVEVIKNQNIRCSVIGLSAELRICRHLSKETKGSYGIILDETHFKELLHEHLYPPTATANTESSLIRMGFPHRRAAGDEGGVPSMCMCHLDSQSSSQGFGLSGYFCPQCQSKYCELPVECKACGLTLVSAPHLARSYHHLFGMEAFVELERKKLPTNITSCMACQKTFTDQKVLQCKSCSEYFCFDCDMFIHETLHTCPGCANTAKVLHEV